MFFYGLDGWAYMRPADPADRLLLEAIRDKLEDLHERDRKALAGEIVNTLGEALP